MAITYNPEDIWGLQQGVDYTYVPQQGTTNWDMNGRAYSSSNYAPAYYILHAPAATSPVSAPTSLPEPSLEGQTWGRVIPITAGYRSIPGRPLWFKVRQVGEEFFLDTAISYGWRAEIMAGDPPVDMTILKETANGVVIYNRNENFTAPGVSRTEYNGTQTTPDTFLVSEAPDGGGSPAYVFHIYTVLRNIPLKPFNNQRPDAWSLLVQDHAVGSAVTASAPVFLGYDATSNNMYTLEAWSWSSGAAALYGLNLASGYISGPLYGTAPGGVYTSVYFARACVYAPTLGKLVSYVGSGSNDYRLLLVNPTTGVVEGFTPEVVTFPNAVSQQASTAVSTAGGATCAFVTMPSFVSSANHLLWIFTVSGSSIALAYTSAGGIDGQSSSAFYTVNSNLAGGPAVDGYPTAYFVTKGSGAELKLVSVSFNGSSAAYATTTWDPGFAVDIAGLVYSTASGTWFMGWEATGQSGCYEWGGSLNKDGLPADLWSQGGVAYYHAGGYPWHFNSAVGDAILFASGTEGTYYALNTTTGDVSTFADPLPGTLEAIPGNLESAPFAFNSLGGARIVPRPWSGTALSTTGEVLGITLARAYELLAGQTRHLKDKLDIDASIVDVLDSLFIVEGRSFNDFAMAINKFCACDIREDNDRLDVIRTVDSTTFTINETLIEDGLLRQPNGYGLQFSRTAETDLPAEFIGQYVDSSQTFKFSERPARRELGPKPTTISTKKESVRVPLGMDANKAQTYASNTLYRIIEARDKVEYRLPFAWAVAVQAGDVHAVPDGDDQLIVKVTRADRQPDRTVNITAERLLTVQDYVGEGFAGEVGTGFTPVAAQSLILGGIGSTSAVYTPSFNEPAAPIIVGNASSTATPYAPTFSANSAPTITSGTSFSAAENQTAITTLTATDPEGDGLTWSIIGGADAAKFSLTSGGVLTFASAPDYETPTDADANNVYVVTVQVSDGTSTDAETISVTVTDVSEIAHTLSPTDKHSTVTLSNGNLTAVVNDSSWRSVRSTTSKSSGKWAFEWTLTNDAGTGFQNAAGLANSTASLANYIGADANGVSLLSHGQIFEGGGSVATPFTSGAMVTGAVVAFYVDLDARTFTMRLGATTSASRALPSGLATGAVFASISSTNGSSSNTLNFGATAFTYSLPSGYAAWNT